MRCLTLANELQNRGADAIYFCGTLPQHFQQKLAQLDYTYLPINTASRLPSPGDHVLPDFLGVALEADASATRDALSRIMVDWLVVDNYALDERWERVLRPVAKKILVIDDLADRKHDCDILLDQNFYLDSANRYDEKVPRDCHLLLGPRFALLRAKFSQLHGTIPPRQSPVKRLLVFFGGVDIDNYTGAALGALADLGENSFQVDVVIGAEHPALESIREDCLSAGYTCHVQTDQMAALMGAADLALGAGGTATWERACLGLPTLVICTADNQRQQVADAAVEGLIYAPEFPGNIRDGFSRHLKALLENPALRGSISSNCLKLVDGNGAARVAAHMGFIGIEFRKASQDDAQSLFLWRNEESVRSASRSRAPISWEQHSRWLSALLNDPSRELLIGMRDNKAVGVVRFDITDGLAEVSIYLVPGAEVKCRGSELMWCAEAWLRVHRPEVLVLQAEVLGHNERSSGMFRATGFDVERILFSKRLH